MIWDKNSVIHDLFINPTHTILVQFTSMIWNVLVFSNLNSCIVFQDWSHITYFPKYLKKRQKKIGKTRYEIIIQWGWVKSTQCPLQGTGEWIPSSKQPSLDNLGIASLKKINHLQHLHHHIIVEYSFTKVYLYVRSSNSISKIP